jgi:hypothetical protein
MVSRIPTYAYSYPAHLKSQNSISTSTRTHRQWDINTRRSIPVNISSHLDLEPQCWFINNSSFKESILRDSTSLTIRCIPPFRSSQTPPGQEPFVACWDSMIDILSKKYDCQQWATFSPDDHYIDQPTHLIIALLLIQVSHSNFNFKLLLARS